MMPTNSKKWINKFARFTCLLLCMVLLSGLAFAADVPKLKARVNDYANILSAQTKQNLETKLAALEESDSTQIVVLTIKSLKGDSLEEYSMRVVEDWQIGQKEVDNGALLLISNGDRKIRIEVGYGLEGKLTDLLAGRIINSIITPAFKQGNFDKGVTKGVEAMIGAVKGEFTAESIKSSSQSGETDFGGIIAAVFFGFIFFRKVLPSHTILSAFFGAIILPILGIIFGAGSLMMLIILAIIGAVLGFLVGLAPTSSGSSSSGGVSPWIGGGGSSSGGFGGFSGGGGGFGGGGASGGW